LCDARVIARRSAATLGRDVFGSLRQTLSRATLFQLAAELAWVFAAIIVVFRLGGKPAATHFDAAILALFSAVVMISLNGAFGLYHRSRELTTTGYALRVFLAPAIGIPLAFLGVQVLPGADTLQDQWALAVLVAVLGLLLVRHAVVLPLAATLVPHRVLVLGAGPEARLVEASLAASRPLGMMLVGFYPLGNSKESVVTPSKLLATDASLEQTVQRLSIDEVIVAVRQQRGGVLPLRELLDCRLGGVQVSDLAGFFERVYGQVAIESLKVSWLIYGHGFRQNPLRNFIKRAFDVVVSAMLIVATGPFLLLAALMIALGGGGPVIYRQERVGYRGKTFTVLKLRSMARDAEKDGRATWATENDSRITKVGRWIRRARIDEIPQLLNVLRGEMSFVGPRPERPEFVAMLTEQIPFYAVRQSVKPGLTGWAQVRYSYGASVEQSVRKLEYDLYYVKNHTLLLDLVILLETVRVVLLGEGAR
jgi:sugar transferase (PEP-CTERM system associated)